MLPKVRFGDPGGPANKYATSLLIFGQDDFPREEDQFGDRVEDILGDGGPQVVEQSDWAAADSHDDVVFDGWMAQEAHLDLLQLKRWHDILVPLLFPCFFGDLDLLLLRSSNVFFVRIAVLFVRIAVLFVRIAVLDQIWVDSERCLDGHFTDCHREEAVEGELDVGSFGLNGDSDICNSKILIDYEQCLKFSCISLSYQESRRR